MDEGLLVEEMTARFEPVDDDPVCREDLLTGQPVWSLGREAARLIHRA